MSAITDLISAKILSGAKSTTAANVREVLLAMNGAFDPSIESDTYANWAIKKTASTLPVGKCVFVSDKSVYLQVIAANKFALNGIWKNTVAGVDYYNDCQFDFSFTQYGETGRFVFITDRHGNTVYNKQESNAGTSNFQFNTAAYRVANSNIDSGGELSISSNLGGINSVRVQGGCNVIANMNIGVSIAVCLFHGHNGGTVILDPAVSYVGKIYILGLISTFDVSIGQTGLTTLTNHVTYGAHIGIFNLTSANATETINLFANMPLTHPFRIYPATGLTITFAHGTGTNQPQCKGGVNAVMNGANKEWIEFTKVGNDIFETDRSVNNAAALYTSQDSNNKYLRSSKLFNSYNFI